MFVVEFDHAVLDLVAVFEAVRVARAEGFVQFDELVDAHLFHAFRVFFRLVPVEWVANR